MGDSYLGIEDTQMAHCLWNDFEGNRKLHLANWNLVCMKKEFGVCALQILRKSISVSLVPGISAIPRMRVSYGEL